MSFLSWITPSFRCGAKLYFLSTNSFEILVICICLHVSGWKVNSHFSLQSIRISRSCCSSWWSLSDSRILNIFVSSANRNTSKHYMFGRSLNNETLDPPYYVFCDRSMILAYRLIFYGALCRMLFGSPCRCRLLPDPCLVPLSIYQEMSIVVVLLIYPL